MKKESCQNCISDGKATFSRNKPNFLLPQADHLDKGGIDSLLGHCNASNFCDKRSVDSSWFHNIKCLSDFNISLPAAPHKTILATGINISIEDKVLCQCAELSIQQGDPKTSHTSDSGLSSHSPSSEETSNITAFRIPNQNIQEVTSNHSEHAEHKSSSNSNSHASCYAFSENTLGVRQVEKDFSQDFFGFKMKA